ncbi:hypothetical protein EYF80_013516 [Liparis tanakae]|uniref:Uncharacterized protein n=1 Tax=Liparis tanakae TaxID=230148 RepID=A0A4Z2IDZ1_9TELE|nr:hypothetical protein EYF80_013516 [Liparis tanakae]
MMSQVLRNPIRAVPAARTALNVKIPKKQPQRSPLRHSELPLAPAVTGSPKDFPGNATATHFNRRIQSTDLSPSGGRPQSHEVLGGRSVNQEKKKKASFVLTLLAVNTSGTDAESDPENGKKRLHSISDVFGL